MAAVNRQFPAEPLQWLPETLRLPWEEGMRLLQEAGFQVCPPGISAWQTMGMRMPAGQTCDKRVSAAMVTCQHGLCWEACLAGCAWPCLSTGP